LHGRKEDHNNHAGYKEEIRYDGRAVIHLP
jgi:hypothetical protein